YLLNLIDTPGHVDFSYEVARSLQACEGALLVVDAAQGVEAQTVANVYLAVEANLEIIPVLNKIDLPSADIDGTMLQIEEELGIDTTNVVKASAKAGIGIEEILEAIVKHIPPPKDAQAEPLRALIFDSWFDAYLGAVSLVRVMTGEVKKGMRMKMMSTGNDFEVLKVAKLTPKLVEVSSLTCGMVGVVSGSIKTVRDTKVGDTITSASKPAPTALAGFQDAKQMVFGGIFPVESSEYTNLKDSLEKLLMNDASLTMEPESSQALGFGYRVGFLGLLHMDIIQERLEREYNLDLIFTAPTVVYNVKTSSGDTLRIENPSKLPDANEIEVFEEPYVRIVVHTPEEYIGAILKILQDKRGIQQDIEYNNTKKIKIIYELPMNEMIFDFHD
ncbi:MAG: translation elongation factor 4, partial [Bdellovibrionota bacterium]